MGKGNRFGQWREGFWGAILKLEGLAIVCGDGAVTQVTLIEQNRWSVTFADGEERPYKGVILCNGHHWCKRFPEFEGEFAGDIIHAKDYKHARQLQGK